jgi:hypothetical protein
MRRSVALLTILPALSAACSGGVLVEMEVDHYQIPCLEERLHLCLLTRQEDNQTWDRFFEPIEDWSLTWGERSRLRLVKRQKLSAYGGEFDVFQLDEVLSTEAMEPGTSFTYPFRPNEQDPALPMVTRIAGTLRGALADGRSFECDSEEICGVIDDSLGASTTLVLDIAYDDPIEEPLRIRDAILEP